MALQLNVNKRAESLGPGRKILKFQTKRTRERTN